MVSTLAGAYLALLAAAAVAHPLTSLSQPRRFVARANPAAEYRPVADSVYVPSRAGDRLQFNQQSPSYVQTAVDFAKETDPQASFRVVEDHYQSKNGVGHVYLKQTHNGIDITNADMNINIAPDGSILSYGSSFVKGELSAARLNPDSYATPVTAFKSVRDTLNLPLATVGVTAQQQSEHRYQLHGVGGSHQPPTAELSYYKMPDQSLKPVWMISTDLWRDWYETFVVADDTSEVVASINHAKDATYKVYPWGVMDPTDGERAIVSNPWDKAASEYTWQGDGFSQYDTTWGNNAVAQANWNGSRGYIDSYRPHNPRQEFIYDLDLADRDWHHYGNASVTQLFYTVNMYHDLLYELGFDEKAGNFETNVAGDGGVGHDFVIANAQDAGGINNAVFLTRPDGKPGRMWMYMWAYTKPHRDGAFDAHIVIHEATHGLSNRLTGGPQNVRCLDTVEAGGMGEGWGDAMGNAVRIHPADDRSLDIVLAAWVFNSTEGIRRHPYSTSLDTNPYTYASINGMFEVHNVGEVWAAMLYELLWNLVEAHPIDDAIRPTFDARGVPTNGRFLWMQLVVDGMKLQPCSPTFVQARDAILDADFVLTKGANECAIWTAFAKRGLGSSALSASKPFKNHVKESFDLPDDVC